MMIDTRLFGPVDIKDDEVYRFPDGLLGFEELCEFALIEAEELRPLKWLVSMTEPDLAFPIADPRYFGGSYEVPIGREDQDALDVDSDDEIVIYTIVTLPDDDRPLTANLRGPVVLNLSNRIGRQMVLLDERYSHRQPLEVEQHAAP